MGKVFLKERCLLMKMKDLKNKILFMNEMTNIYSIYAECLDEYFKNEKNREDHKELYQYYLNLIDNIKNNVKKYNL